jgi:hypothetical protein
MFLVSSQKRRLVFVSIPSMSLCLFVNERGKVGGEDRLLFSVVLPAIFRGLSTSERDPATRLRDWEGKSQWR